MLRLVLLVLYLIASNSSGQTKAGGGLDPDGVTAPAPPTADIAGNLDPDGLTAPAPPTAPPADIGGGLDPDG